MTAPCERSGSAVEFCDVSFSYEAEQGASALDRVSLEIPWGQCLVLTGPSGCGKTTMTRLVNGLIPASYRGMLDGSVRIAGIPLLDWEQDELCRMVGSVFQNPRSQFFNLDTTSEVAFGCENIGITRNEIKRRVDEAFMLLGIEQLEDRDIFALSGGQRQMVAIASACAMGPDIFVFDEPTASLDVISMRRLAQVIARLKALGKTIVVAEHRLWWLSDIADRVVVVRDGRIVYDDSADGFARMSGAESTALGLRSWDVSQTKLRCRRFPDKADGSSQAPSGERLAKGANRVPSGEDALSIDDLHAVYRRSAEVLCGASASFSRGSITALIGKNGAGKTTLARCIVGLHRESGGTISFEGECPKRRDRPKHAFLVMQEPGYQLFSDSVRGELGGALSQGGAREPAASEAAVDEALSRFGLAQQAMRHPLSLSGGQRQRLAIAVGISQGAAVLVLDEPTSGLDFDNMQRVADELRRVCDDGTCAIIITHDYEFICSACDAAAVVCDGRVGETLSVSEENALRIREILGFGS